MKDMNRAELIELVAAASLRIYAFVYTMGAFRDLYHFLRYLNHDNSPLAKIAPVSSYLANGYIMEIAFDTLTSAVIFLLAVPLARLLCRGLSHALEPKPSE
jgi:ABC-type glucose/galactose transport system permease subunit